MDMESHTTGNITVLELAGRFDAYTAPPVAEWLDKSGAARTVVNLSGVGFVDSSALAVLVKGMKRCRERQGDLYLCSLQQPVRIIFELTRLDKAFEIFADEAAAVGALA